MSSRELIIIAGPNGSGKTTFARSFLKDNKYAFLNADQIAVEIGSKNKSANSIAAGKEYFKRLEILFKKKKNIIIESTLSGLFMKGLIERFKKEEYKTTIIFIVLETPQKCIERIQERVRKGGHFIEDIDVKRRYFRSINNFWKDYKNKADNWVLLNNTESSVEEVASGTRNLIDILNEKLFEDFKTLLN